MTEIEAATPLHAPAMAVVHAAAFPAAERWDTAAIAMQLGMPGTFGAVHRRGGMILARATAGDAEVLTLAVAPAVRRQGIGGALLRHVMAAAWQRGAEAMFLEVSDANAPARHAYATAGFRPAGRRPRYYPDGTDALLLRVDAPHGA